MTNVTVQEALKAAIKAMELANISCEHFHHKKKHQHLYGEKCIPEDMWKDALELCKTALAEIDKCEPVGELILDPAFLPALKAPLVNWKINLVDLEVGTKLYTSPQPRECEPVAEALHERNRLGYAVVDVIGTLDEIIENAQEVEVDDFLHIAIPIDKWHELQDALEEMPKRAELYTSPQPIDKCAPVYLIVSGADEIVVTKEKYDSWTSAKRISYTSPISKEWVDVPYEERRELYKSVSKGNIDGFADLLSAKLKQLNFPEKG